MKREPVVLERVFDATLDDVWDLWTSKEGIESWWGPEGFGVEVQRLDLRVGGQLLYTMRALAPEMVAFMESEGQPVSSQHSAVFTEVVPQRLLAYDHVVDFVPGVEPYAISHRVELEETPEGVRMTLSFTPMHDDTWTERARMGWQSELGKLAKVLVTRRS